MEINRLDAHDRLLYFKKQNFSIDECCKNLIDQKPFGHHPFYIFAHARTEDDDMGTKRLVWQPRLTKPLAQTNSMLFKAYPGTDLIRIIWMIPPRELWKQFEKDKMTASETIVNSIHDFKYNRGKLEAPEPDDLSDSQISGIYLELSLEANSKKRYKKI